MTPVTLLDGPCAGRPVSYYQPLPAVLVVADKSNGIRYHDYAQHGPLTYRHARTCKCLRRQWPTVNLDAARV